MKQKRKLSLLMAMVCAVSMLFSGCSGDSKPEQETSAPAVQEEAKKPNRKKQR